MRDRKIGNGFPLLEGRVRWDTGKYFFGKFVPKKCTKPQVFHTLLGIHSMGASSAPGEGFTPEGLGRVTWSSSDPEHQDFGSSSLDSHSKS